MSKTQAEKDILTAVPRTRLPDPMGMIARIRNRLNPQCAVRLSPFCDVIISMRMQGVEYRHIEKWLIEQGPQYRISPAAILRNLKNTKLHVQLTYAEEMLENLGGQVDVDLIQEMSKNVWTQKQRIDGMVRAEAERRAKPGEGGYTDRRIRHEMEVYGELLKNLHTFLQDAPIKAQQAIEAEQKRMDADGLMATKDALDVIRDLLLNNELSMGITDVVVPNRTKH